MESRKRLLVELVKFEGYRWFESSFYYGQIIIGDYKWNLFERLRVEAAEQRARTTENGLINRVNCPFTTWSKEKKKKKISVSLDVYQTFPLWITELLHAARTSLARNPLHNNISTRLSFPRSLSLRYLAHRNISRLTHAQLVDAFNTKRAGLINAPIFNGSSSYHPVKNVAIFSPDKIESPFESTNSPLLINVMKSKR